MERYMCQSIEGNKEEPVCTSEVPLSVESSVPLQQQIWLSFISKPQVTMRYFCIITKTACAMPIVNCDRVSKKFIDFYWFRWNNTTENRIGITFHYTLYVKSFNFRPVILPEILFDKKALFTATPSPISSIWHCRASAVLRIKKSEEMSNKSALYISL